MILNCLIVADAVVAVVVVVGAAEDDGDGAKAVADAAGEAAADHGCGGTWAFAAWPNDVPGSWYSRSGWGVSGSNVIGPVLESCPAVPCALPPTSMSSSVCYNYCLSLWSKCDCPDVGNQSRAGDGKRRRGKQKKKMSYDMLLKRFD